MLRLVLDSNIFISALVHRHGTTGRLLDLWRAGMYDLIVSDRLLGELEAVLRRPKFGRVGAEDAAELLGVLRESALRAPDPPAGAPLTRDPADDYLIRLAHAANAHAVVSGDAHLLELPPTVCRVLTPRAAVELLER